MTIEREFENFINHIRILRGDGGCPWDREQTIESMKSDLLSEANEVAEAIDNKDYENLEEELGDLMWSASLIAEIAGEEGLFDIEGVLSRVNKKMVDRHPFVFGDVKAEDAEEATRIFNEIKSKEKG